MNLDDKSTETLIIIITLAGMQYVPTQNVAVQFVRDIVNIKTLTFKCRFRIYFKDGTFLASTRHK